MFSQKNKTLPSEKTDPKRVLTDAERLASKQENYVSPINDRNLVGKLELLEERAVVNKERLDVGKIIATKHIRTKQINVPIELIEEVLTIETSFDSEDSKALLSGNYEDKDIIRHVEPTLDSVAVVNINGKQVELGDEPVEIILSRQVAVINKETYVVQEVAVEKSQHTHQDTINVALKREELDVIEEGLLDHKDTD